jgi:hypothetical protein
VRKFTDGKVYNIANQSLEALVEHAGESVRLTGNSYANAITVSKIGASPEGYGLPGPLQWLWVLALKKIPGPSLRLGLNVFRGRGHCLAKSVYVWLTGRNPNRPRPQGLSSGHEYY